VLRLGSHTGFGQLTEDDKIIASGGASRKLVAILGQSNAVGQGDSALVTSRSDLSATYAAVNVKRKTAQGPAASDPIVWTTDVTETLRPYTSSVANIAGATTTCIGIEQSMGRYLDEVLADSWDLTIFGESGTSIAAHWHPSSGYPSGGDNLYTQALDHVDAAAASFGAEVTAVVWIQGESDAQDATRAANYETNLTAVLSGFQARWPGVPIIINQLSVGCTAAFTSTVRTAQAAVAATLSGVHMIGCDDLYVDGDGFHFNSNSNAVLGDRAGIAILDALDITDTHTWTTDATSGKGMPANAKEWETYLGSVGLSGYQPMSQWSLSVASAASLTDALQLRGAVSLTVTGTNATFQAPVAGWSAQGITVTNGATFRATTTNGLLPNLATDNCAALMYMRVASAPSAIRTPLLFGTTVHNLRIDTTPRFRSDSGVNNAVGTVDPTGQVRPYMLVNDVTGSLSLGLSDQEKLSPTRGAVTGKQYGFGWGSNPAGSYIGLMTLWGPRVRFTSTTAKTLLEGLNWTIPWS
jgi:hypothetical protein